MGKTMLFLARLYGAESSIAVEKAAIDRRYRYLRYMASDGLVRRCLQRNRCLWRTSLVIRRSKVERRRMQFLPLLYSSREAGNARGWFSPLDESSKHWRLTWLEWSPVTCDGPGSFGDITLAMTLVAILWHQVCAGGGWVEQDASSSAQPHPWIRYNRFRLEKCHLGSSCMEWHCL